MANNHLDGLNIVGTTAYAMEMMERLDVLNGLSGSLYGPANPAGMFNYVQKRPTDEPLRRLSIDYTTKSAYGVRADLGGKIGDNKWFGYRINLVDGNGEHYVDQSNLQRRLASFAFDLRFAPATVVEADFSHYQFLQKGFPGGFQIASGIPLPSAPDPTRVGYGQSYAGLGLTTDTSSARLKHDFNPDWHLTAGVLEQRADRMQWNITNVITNTAGDYSSRVGSANPAATRFRVFSDLVYLNGRVMTGDVRHDLMFGTIGFEHRLYTGLAGYNQTLGSANLSNPQVFPEPANFPSFDNNIPRYQNGVNRSQAQTIGDTVTFNSQWSSILAVSQSRLLSRSFSKTGTQTSGFDQKGTSPSLSLVYKPYMNWTTYVTYADSLQMGEAAPAGTANVGATLQPYRSKQWEGGVKTALWNKLDLSAAVFRIDRPYTVIDTDNVFKTRGDQIHSGLELMAVGEAAKGLNIYGGITYIDPKVENATAAVSGKTPVGVPKIQANLFSEYRVAALSGLTLSLNLHHTGTVAADYGNTTYAAAYNTIDIGARYISQVMGKTTIWRLNVNNLTDKHYWISVFPSAVFNSGPNSTPSNYPDLLGAPREIKASVQLDF